MTTHPPAPFDLPDLLARLAGNRALMAKLLGMFARDFATVPAELRGALTGDQPGLACTRVHALKGVAANLSATAVHAAAGALESALRAGDDARAATLAGPLIVALEEALQAARDLQEGQRS